MGTNKGKKRTPYRKRAQSREEELRRHLLMAAGVVAAALVVVLLIVVLRPRSGGNATQSQQASAGGEGTSAGTITAAESGGDVVEAEPDSTLADAEDLSQTSSNVAESGDESTASDADSDAESAVTQAIPIDQQERVVTDTSGDWRLVLVNPTHMLPEDFYVDTAVIGFSDDEDLRFDERAVDALDEMLYDCRAAGCSPVVRAGYRSQSTQEYLYERKIEEWMDDEGYSREEAEEVAATIVAYPGTSEHQLGLSADIADVDYPTLNASQGDSPTQQWLMAHCQEYGFILRFPDGKSDFTGIIYEPWHYRYVGKEVAEEIMSRGICLEEYLAEHGVV